MATALKWGILGTGTIAHTFARGLPGSKPGRPVAVGSRTKARVDQFAEEFNVARRYERYEALLADEQVEAVYISTPHPSHAQWSIKAAEARKHVLCEKPLAMNLVEATSIVAATR